jgi:rhamnose utilization protein RhaD (predicted bifunctional aldolase and dehydrogenase)
MDELASLREISAELGTDAMQVQAGGGNTSAKTDAGLWIKASGTRLRDALRSNIFVLLPWTRLESWKAGSDDALTAQDPGGNMVRASVETAMHLALPHRYVAHTHSVRTISWLIQDACAAELSRRLEGLKVFRMPYIHPGRTLAEEIERAIAGLEVDVLLLENHGLVVGADDPGQLRDRLRAIEHRLDGPLRPNAVDPDEPTTEDALPSWMPVQGSARQMAFDEDAMRIASGGTLYPDHCVYLGPSVAAAENPTAVADALMHYEKLHGVAAKALLVGGLGAFVRAESSPACAEMLLCLGNVVQRTAPGAQVSYLQPSAVALLMNWDAEAYRLQVAAELAARTQG